MSGIISLWNRCNSNCIMCTNPYGYRAKEDERLYRKKMIIDKMKRQREEIKKNGLHFTGGEPTIHPNFLEIIRESRKLFPDTRIGIATNGRRFVYQEFTKKFLEIGNINIEIAIHGADAETHDGITRTPGSFHQTVKGLRNIFLFKNKSHSVEIRIILLQQNYKNLGDIYLLLKKNFPNAERVVTIFPELEGRAERNKGDVALTYSQVGPIIKKETERWSNRFTDFMLYHFPLCTLDSGLWRYTVRTVEEYELTFLDSCKNCFYKDCCLGIYKDYIRIKGKDEFIPIKKSKKNVKTDPRKKYRPILES